MGNVTVNISFRDSLLADIDAEATRESRSRSELLREAVRLYIRRQRQWADVFALGDRLTTRLGLTEALIPKEMGTARRRKP